MKVIESIGISGVFHPRMRHTRSTPFHASILRACLPTAAMLLSTLHGTAQQTSVLTQHNDNGRTGQNTSETILKTSNVNVNQFGKLFSLAVTGQVYAQPLYVPNVTINSVVHNLLIVATEEDIVYAFDADNAGSPLWTAILVDSNHGGVANETFVPSSSIGCTDLQPNIGVTSTPVIDATAGTIYVEAKSRSGGTYFHRLHTLDIKTGAEKSPGPVHITASVSGTGDGSVSGTLSFDSYHHNARPGLLLLNGSVYVSYASHCDFGNYHGWLFAYNASTLARQSVFVTTPNGGLGGFWMAGSGIAADGSDIYISSGNGDFDTTNVPATELGDTVMKLGTTGGNLTLQDYFTPSDQSCLADQDNDLGSGGVLLPPNQPGAYPNILVAAGKEGAIYVLNRDQFTLSNQHFQDSANCVTSDPQVLEESGSGAVGGMWSMPAYWNETLYFWGAGDFLKSIPFVDGLPDFTNVTHNSTYFNFPGATPSISSSGNTPGTAILWAIDSSQYGDPGPGPGPAVLYAFDATNIHTKLWDSTQAPNNRDTAGNAVKFSVPTVVNGKVYVGATNTVNVYGLIPGAVLTAPAQGSTFPGASVTFSWTTGSSSVTAYDLWLGTKGVNTNNLYSSGSITGTSVSLTTLPTNGVKVYARLWSLINGVWTPADYTFTEAGTPSPASLTSPAPGSTLAGSSAAFSWTTGSGPTQYQLWLGTTGVGASNVYNSGSLTTTSANVTVLPTNGVKLYARLWSLLNGVWQSADYTYTEAGTPSQAALTSPAPGSVLTGSSATFSWTAGSGPTQYELWLGTTGVGASNIYNSGPLNTTSANVAVLPTNGVKLYARLWSRISGAWQSTDYTYTEAGTPAPASLTSPTPGSQLAGSSATFSWTAGTGVTAYQLWLGNTGVNTNNLYNSGTVTGTSVNVTSLPTNGVTIYVRLWSMISGVWQPADYTITEAGTPSKASLTSPTPGSQLPGSSVTFNWTTGTGPIAYELWLGSTGVGSSNLYNSGSITSTSASVNGLPTNGTTVYARLWSRLSGVWQSTDYTYTAQ